MASTFALPLQNPVTLFLLVLFIILVAPSLMNRLRLPGIVGYILAGVLVGPYGLHLLARNAAMELLATIGLLYIMFLAGLQLDMRDFRQKRNRSLIFGLLTFAIPILLGFPVCLYLLHQPLLAALLTASMFATHTLIAYPIVTRYHINNNEAVAVAVGGTILTDTAVLLIFSVIMGARHGQLNLAFWLHLVGYGGAFLLIILLLVPWVSSRLLPHLKGEAPSFIYILLIVFLAAFLAQLAGLEPIIGAFTAGMVLNRFVPAGSALMGRVSFTGNALFIPFFLISVGMLVDLRVLLNGTFALIVAGSLTLVALAGKWLAAWAGQRFFRYDRVQRQLLFGLSSSHAAATMAIILAGYNAGIIGDAILNGTILLIMVTCLVASFVTQHAARAIAGRHPATAIDRGPPDIVKTRWELRLVKLTVIQFKIFTLLLQQFPMAAAFDNLSIFQYEDLIRVSDGG